MDALKKVGAQVLLVGSQVGSHVVSGVETGYHGARTGATKLGDGLKDARDYGMVFTDNVLHHGDHEFVEDEAFIAKYKRALNDYGAGLKYVNRTCKRMANVYWPQLFKVNLRVARGFYNVVGDIQFKGIDEYYEMWDKAQPYQIIPEVDPHQHFDVVEAIQHEQELYQKTVEKLKLQVCDDWLLVLYGISTRIAEVQKHLHRARKWCKLWYKKRMQYDKVRRRIDKLGKKQGELDDKEKLQLTELQTRLDHALAEFSKINNRVKSTLPHLVLFCDEFTLEVTNRVIFQQLLLFARVRDELLLFSVYFGLLADGEVGTYEDAVHLWRIQFEDAKREVETIVEATDDVSADTLDLQATKMLHKLNKKVKNQKWTYKNPEGVFNVELEADPWDNFEEYYNPKLNRGDGHLNKMIDRPRTSVVEVQLEQPQTPPDKELPLPPASAPALPPRPNVAPLPLVLTFAPLPQKIGAVAYDPDAVSPAPPPLPPRNNAPPPRPPQRRLDSLSLIALSASISLVELEALMALLAVLLVALEELLRNSTEDQLYRTLEATYNLQKNLITECPVPDFQVRPPVIAKPKWNADLAIGAVKLTRAQLMFANLASAKPVATKTAKYDFPGYEPGDLAMEQGQLLDVLVDLQATPAAFSTTGENWMVARIGTRVGFIPSNYVE